jgi:membrane protein YdbS with pleckstrin-like domain
MDLAKFQFPGKEKDEKVSLLARRHILILIRHNVIFALYFLIPVVIFVSLYYFEIDLATLAFFPIIILIASLYYLFVCLFALIRWVEYYYDVWIVTDKRLIDVEQVSLFNHVTSELRLDKIQDVTVEIKGLLPSMFHYGNIYVQTAGAIQRFSFEEVPNPQQIKTLIIGLQDQLGSKIGANK